MDELAEVVEAELKAQAAPRMVTQNSEAWSWRIGSDGDAWLQGTESEPSLVAQRSGGVPFPEPFDPGAPGEVERVVSDVLRTLS